MHGGLLTMTCDVKERAAMATPDQAVAALSKYGGTVLKTSLSEDDEKVLQDALHGDQETAQ